MMLTAIMDTPLSVWFNVAVHVLALKCAYRIAASVSDMAESLRKVQFCLMDRNAYAREAFRRLGGCRWEEENEGGDQPKCKKGQRREGVVDADAM